MRGADCIHLAQNTDQLQALVNALMKLPVPQKCNTYLLVNEYYLLTDSIHLLLILVLLLHIC
jgi:hypothetical protein